MAAALIRLSCHALTADFWKITPARELDKTLLSPRYKWQNYRKLHFIPRTQTSERLAIWAELIGKTCGLQFHDTIKRAWAEGMNATKGSLFPCLEGLPETHTKTHTGAIFQKPTPKPTPTTDITKQRSIKE